MARTEQRREWMQAHRQRKAWGDPLQRPARAEIVRRGRVMATVYVRQGESLDEMQARAQRMAAGYSGKVVIHEA